MGVVYYNLVSLFCSPMTHFIVTKINSVVYQTFFDNCKKIKCKKKKYLISNSSYKSNI